MKLAGSWPARTAFARPNCPPEPAKSTVTAALRTTSAVFRQYTPADGFVAVVTFMEWAESRVPSERTCAYAIERALSAVIACIAFGTVRPVTLIFDLVTA